MSNNSGEIWVNIETGYSHGGDQLPGDREATPEEYDRFLERDFVGIKEKKSQELKAIRDQKEAGGFFYLDKIFDSNQLSVQRISNTSQTYLMGKLTNQELPSIGWTTQDNEVVDLTPDQVLGMQQALTIHGAKVHAIYGELKALVEQAETIEEMELINWPEALEATE